MQDKVKDDLLLTKEEIFTAVKQLDDIKKLYPELHKMVMLMLLTEKYLNGDKIAGKPYNF